MKVQGQHLEGITIRPAHPDDDRRIVPLLASTLGWDDDGRHLALFEWKHRANPFGSSPGWVAEDNQGLVGSRTFMRWRMQVGYEMVSAVRAVDTATHPRAQGRGIFRALTLTGVEALTASGVGWVFNTPNAKSAPGYFKMGWTPVGRLGVSIRPSRLAVLPRLLSARQSGDLWSTATSIGEEASSVLEDADALEELLASAASQRSGVRTVRTPEFLRWRYGQCPVGYRALLAGSKVTDGVLLFRLRRRGPALEAVIGEVLLPPVATRKQSTMLWRQLLQPGEADYAIVVGACHPRFWFPVPRYGPLLTWRPLAWQGAMPPLDTWDLNAGDVELF